MTALRLRATLHASVFAILVCLASAQSGPRASADVQATRPVVKAPSAATVSATDGSQQNPGVFQWLQLAVEYLGLVTAVLAVLSFIQSVKQRRRNFDQSQIKCAILAAERITNEARVACIMLDYRAHDYDMDGTRIELTQEDVCNGLRVPGANQSTLQLGHNDEFVRASFDTLFYRLSILAAELEVDLYTWNQVCPFIGYYVDILRWPQFKAAMLAFARQYGYYRVYRIIDDERAFPVAAEVRRIRANAGATVEDYWVCRNRACAEFGRLIPIPEAEQALIGVPTRRPKCQSCADRLNAHAVRSVTDNLSLADRRVT